MIRPRDSLQLALRAITAHRLRSFLTLLGIAVGIAAVILLTSIGEGIHRFVLAEFTQFGTNVISVAPGKTKTSGHGADRHSDLGAPADAGRRRALEHLPHITGMTATVWGNTEVNANGRLRRTTVNGVSAEMLKVFSIKVRSGQFLPPRTPTARAPSSSSAPASRKNCSAAKTRWERVRVGGLQFRVIGVLEAKGQFLGIDLDDAAYIPTARALELYNRDGIMKIDLSYEEGVPAAAVSALVKATLKARHGREDFTITTQEDMLRTLSNILDVLTMAVGALGSISLLVGGVGIVTIMTIAVTERTGEIGLLVALGAPRRTILGLFLGEAVALSALGGLLGLLLGFGLAQLIHLLVPALPVHTPLSFVALAEGIAVAIGLLAGVLPARRAARLNAVDALRAE
jgi:putative ABC transport system permease protein